MRGLTTFFFNELKSGSLNPLLQYVLDDNTLDLEIRDNYINIYYRGGNILRVKHGKNTGFEFHFEKKYLKQPLSSANSLVNFQNSHDWNNYFPIAKQAMDYYFTISTKHEREFQQLVVRENNNSSIANGTDYFIIDIEYDNHSNARFDLIAVEWLSDASHRKSPKPPNLIVIEMKYGDKALSGNAGMIKHWNDFSKFVNNPIAFNDFKNEMLTILNQKRELGLIPCLSASKNANPITSFSNNIDLAFLIVNHDPASSKLRREISLLGNVDAKFIVSNFMGYGIFKEGVYTLANFVNLYSKHI